MLADLLDLVLPRTCSGCAAPGTVLCSSCSAVLAAPATWTRPTPAPPGLPPVATVAAYDGVIRALLLAHKEHGRTALAAPLGLALARSADLVTRTGADVARTGRPLVLVPVPSAPAAVRARGHDHARRLAGAAARELGLPSQAVLRQARRVGDQAGLATAARAVNLSGGLSARGRLDGLDVVVVDDLVTTGATLAEATRALTSAGARVVGAAVVAATARRCGARGSL